MLGDCRKGCTHLIDAHCKPVWFSRCDDARNSNNNINVKLKVSRNIDLEENSKLFSFGILICTLHGMLIKSAYVKDKD